MKPSKRTECDGTEGMSLKEEPCELGGLCILSKSILESKHKCLKGGTVLSMAPSTKEGSVAGMESAK